MICYLGINLIYEKSLNQTLNQILDTPYLCKYSFGEEGTRPRIRTSART